MRFSQNTPSLFLFYVVFFYFVNKIRIVDYIKIKSTTEKWVQRTGFQPKLRFKKETVNYSIPKIENSVTDFHKNVSANSKETIFTIK